MDKNNSENRSFEGSLKGTKAFNKIRNCFESMERDRDFMLKVGDLRKMLNLPKSGLLFPENKKKALENQSRIFSKLSEKNKIYYWRASADILNNYSLDIFGDVLEYYIMYGSIEPFIIFGSVKFAQVFDLQEIFSEEHYGKIDPMRIGNLEEVCDKLPIAILINPYMSQRDIVDFIKKTYEDWILPIQEDYKSKDTPVGKARKKSSFAKERNEFIIKNNDKPAREIMTLVREKFGKAIDYTYINKIIRDDKNLRN